MTRAEARAAIIAALDAALGILGDPHIAGRLRDPSGDVTFAEIGLDSLAGLAACLSLEGSTGVELDLADLVRHDSVDRLAAHVAASSAQS